MILGSAVCLSVATCVLYVCGKYFPGAGISGTEGCVHGDDSTALAGLDGFHSVLF